MSNRVSFVDDIKAPRRRATRGASATRATGRDRPANLYMRMLEPLAFQADRVTSISTLTENSSNTHATSYDYRTCAG